MNTQKDNIGNLELDVILSESIDESKDLFEKNIEENDSSQISDIAAGVGAKARRFTMIALAAYGISTSKAEAFDWSRFKKQPEVGARTLEKQSDKAEVNYEMYLHTGKKLERLLVELPKAEEEKRRPMLSITSNRRKAPESMSSLNTKADKMLAAAKEAVLSNPFDVVRLNFENLYELYDLYLEGGEDDMRVKTVISKLDDFLKDLKEKDKKAYDKTRVQTTLETVKLGVKLMENAWERGDVEDFKKGFQYVARSKPLNVAFKKEGYKDNHLGRIDFAVMITMTEFLRGGGLDKALGVAVNELTSGYPSKEGRLQNPSWDDVNRSPYHRNPEVSKILRIKNNDKQEIVDEKTEMLKEVLKGEMSLELWKELRMLTRFEQIANLAKDALNAKIGVEQGDIEEVQKYLDRYESEKSEAGGKYIKNFTEFDPPVKPKRVSKR